MTTDFGTALGKSGPWDVAMYLVQKFPTIAVTLLLLAGGLYGAKLTLEEKDKAQRELQAARGEIEGERKAARQEIEAAVTRAADKERAAAEKEQQAAKQVAEARANALLQVQQTLLDSSERIQKLVLGQLRSMEDLEKLRAHTAKEMEGEIGRLDKRRTDLQAQLDEAARKVQLAKVTYAIDNLEEKLNTRSFAVGDAITQLIRSFDVKDQIAVAEIERRMAQSDKLAFRGSLEYVMAIKKSNAEVAGRFANTLKSSASALGADWVSSVFVCCEDLAEPLWNTLYPAVSELVGDANTDIRIRTALLRIVERRSYQVPPILSDARYAGLQSTWQAIAFIVDLLRGQHADQRAYLPGMVRTLGLFDLAAAHVWQDRLLSEATADNDRTQLKELFKYQENDFPVLKDRPAAELIQFWTATDIVAARGDYAAQGTGPAYRRR